MTAAFSGGVSGAAGVSAKQAPANARAARTGGTMAFMRDLMCLPSSLRVWRVPVYGTKVQSAAFLWRREGGFPCQLSAHFSCVLIGIEIGEQMKCFAGQLY